MTLTDFDILLVTLFTWSLKVRFSSMILATATEANTVLNIIDVDKTARRVHLTKIKPEQDHNQQIQSEIYLHRKNNHYSAMAAHKEKHISSE